MVRLLKLIYEMEALVAMADTTDEYGFTLPCVVEGPLHVTAEGLVHPFVENPVANNVDLDQQHRLLFLTGPNMGGKTTYLRAFALALYFGHLGMGVPATSFVFSPVERLFASFTMSDDLRAGVSYFRAEALRVKGVAEALAQDCLFMFSSHLIELSEHLTDNSQISLGYFQAEEGAGRLRFDYRLRPGVSSQRLGVRVLQKKASSSCWTEK